MGALLVIMKLSEYLNLKNMTDSQFSEAIGKDRSVVTKYRLGNVTPPIDVIAAIDKETNGAVSFRDFLSASGAA